MTRLGPDSTVTRETAALERGRPLVVTLHARYAVIHLKGTRQSFVVDYAAMLDLGRKRAYRAAQAARRKAQ